MILETTTRSRAPIGIRVVQVVPVELGLVAVEVEVGHVVRLVAGADILLIPIQKHRRLSLTASWAYMLFLLNFIWRQGRVKL